MKKKYKILITNDDGIEALGLYHLWKTLKEIAEITIVAPSSEKSGVGMALTLRDPLFLRPVKWEEETKAWKLTGNPADCVRLAMNVVLKEKPDLIVSGINHGSNAGKNVFYSGTIGGVIEGAFQGIPGIAFSCDDFGSSCFTNVEKHILSIVNHFLHTPLAQGTILNVNFPDLKEIKGIKLARQGKGYWMENPEKRNHPHGDDYYWHGGKWKHEQEHEESDVALLKKGYATVVPLHIEELTDHRFMELRKADKLFH